ncbi:hypothetical protein ACRE_052850 [Hapsidospora chrysogenum ATCC 11550]|uniref:Uncharacterized protein n=1 Tax=Hapsidospora chrysogenum (strain ATCC 11550 / CBS 779.69 / DSM 880 / IAM 14645 / JCM 23072 / IMI 49137) TaxID=857340 RepID=A0A086T3I9_HAPC1|nr:hypothetical protein ACRE_052850 [Hapsidospora chrysogenum ATCC 11550]
MDACWAGPAPAAPIFIERARDSFPLLPFARISSAISQRVQLAEDAELLRDPGRRKARGQQRTQGDQRPSPSPGFKI